MQYINLLKELFNNNIRYLLCGGLAVNIYGIPRMTADIDILFDFEQDNINRFKKILTKLGYQKNIPLDINSLADEKFRKALNEEKNMIAFSFFNPDASYMTLDILINTPLSFEKMWADKVERKADDFSVFLVSLEHLILMKSTTNREQDSQDIIHLKNLSKQ